MSPYMKISSKWIKDLNLPEIIRLLEEKIGSTLQCIDIGKDFIEKLPKARQSKPKLKKKKWDYIKFKSFCIAKETISKVKKQSMEWGKSLHTTQLVGD